MESTRHQRAEYLIFRILIGKFMIIQTISKIFIPLCEFCSLGSSEVHQVQCVVDGVKLLIEMEKRLEAGKTFDDLIPSLPVPVAKTQVQIRL